MKKTTPKTTKSKQKVGKEFQKLAKQAIKDQKLGKFRAIQFDNKDS